MSENPLILLADDENLLRVVATKMLEGEGYRVITAEDGEECVQKYQAIGPAKIALVVLDNVMPAMSGIEAFREIRRINPAAKVILSSGSVNPRNIDALLEEGLAGSISKPSTRAAFLAEVLRVLNELPPE